jgi:type VI secretion system secreted protein VgrG
MRTLTRIKLETGAYPNGELEISRLTGRDALSQLFEYEVLVIAKNLEDFDPEALIGERATLVYERDDRPAERVHGMISVVNDRLDTEVDLASCRLVFRPRAYRLALVETLDIFLDLNVPDIVRQKLTGAGMKERVPRPDSPDDFDFELRLQDTYPVREFVAQYKETDLAFVSRLCEHIGITYFFEHRGGRDVMVFTDTNEGLGALGGDAIVPFRGRGDQRDVFRLEETIRMIPADYVVRDYNYRTPQVTLTGQANVADGLGSVVEYGSHVATPKEADQLARVRAQESLAARRIFDGTTDLPTLRAGTIFTLQGHPRGDLGLLVTEVVQTITQVTLGSGGSDATTFRSEFKAIRKDRRYRPPRTTPKPRIHGVVTGVIDSANRGQYADIDDQGRYRVKFLFDTTNPGEGQASQLVRMAQPHSGEGYGMHFPLRPGVEVIITFVDGDPDRPIIAATVPNPQTASPVQAGNATRNIIRTGGGNEINIDDAQGGHRIKLSTPHKNTTFQLGYRNSPEDGAMLETEGNTSTVAMTSANTFTSLNTSFSLALKFASGGSIRTVAERAGWFEGITAVGELMAVGLEIAEAQLERYEAQRAKAANELQVKAIKAQNKAKASAALVRHEPPDPAHPTLSEKTEEKNAEVWGKLTAAQKASLEAQKKAYEDAKAQYQADVLELKTNMEWLADAEKGVYLGGSIAQAENYDLAVKACHKKIDGNSAAESQAAKDGSKKTYETRRAEYEAALKAALSTTPANATPEEKAEAATKANELVNGLNDADVAEENGVAAALADFTEADKAKRAWNEKVEENEHGGEVIKLKADLTHVKEAKVANVLFSDVMALIAAIKSFIEKAEGTAEALAAGVTALGAKPRLTLAPTFFGPPVGRMAAIFKTPIHTLGSTSHTRVFGEKDLFLWSEKVVVSGKESVLLTSKEKIGFLSEGNAELAAKETVAITAEDLDIETEKDVTIESKKGALDLTAKKHIHVTSEDALVFHAKKKVTLESEDDELDLKAKKSVFIESTDDALRLKAKKNVSLQSTDAELFISSKGQLGIASVEANVLVESAKQLHARGATGVVITAGPKLSVIATKTEFSGDVEVGGALLVKGDFKPATPVATQAAMQANFTAAGIEFNALKQQLVQEKQTIMAALKRRKIKTHVIR